MSSPPWSKQNPQGPLYMDELRTNWSGSPLPQSSAYVVKVNSTPEKLLELQNKPGVVDFPNVDEDILDSLPTERKLKDKAIKDLLKIKDVKDEKVRDFINRCARCEGNSSWDKDKLFVPDVE